MRKKFLSKLAVSLILIVWAVLPFLAKASVYISEIMYDIDGSDDKKEWVEIYNGNAGEINLKDWRFNDGSNHILNEPPANGGRGSLVLPAYSYAILSSDATTTVANYSAYSGIVIDTVMSLGNTSETLKIIDASGAIIDTVSYNSSMGANGDGNSLQKINGVWSAKSPTFGYANASSAQSSSSSSQENQSSSASISSSSSSAAEVVASGSVAYNYKSEQISAKAGEDKTAVAGADIVLEGNALGFKKEPLLNARYFWNLGDGSYKEGKNIRHIYKYPNSYIAVLNVSSGDISASDRINIKVISNELRIIETKSEFIKLKNKSGIILDVSGWFLKAGGAIFKFPDYSLVAANSELIISSDVSKLKFAGNNFSAELLYPNNSVAFSYLPAGEAGLPASSSSSSSKPKEIIYSKPPEKKVEIAVVPSVVSSKNYSSSSAAADKGQNFSAENNLASVITIGDKKNSGSKIWLILAVITGIIGGAGVFITRKI